MKIAENIAKVESNMTGLDTVEMSVDSASMAHIMNTLTDMYRDPHLALARELISNGIDASAAENGLDVGAFTQFPKPVEVTLPSTGLMGSPVFIVRDYGTGMSRDVLMNVFPKYGASTKRGSNQETGGFGLGAKTPFAVSNNFVVETVQDGKKNVAIFQKNERGIGEGNFLPEVETDEENGTVIKVTLAQPEKLIAIFRDSNLLLGFPSNSITVNGKMAEKSVHSTDLYTPLADNLGWVANPLLNTKGTASGLDWNDRNLKVLVGVISYTLTWDEIPAFKALTDKGINQDALFSLVLNLPIGSVDMTPARDSLITTARTVEAVSNALIAAADALLNVFVERVANAESDADALKAAIRGNAFFRQHADQWIHDGEQVPTTTEVKFAEKTLYGTGTAKTRIEPKARYQPHYADHRSVFVYGVEDSAQAVALNRFRRAFETQHPDGSKLDTTYYFAVGSLDSLNRWQRAAIDADYVFSVEKFIADGTTYRKAQNAEAAARRKEARAEKTATQVLDGTEVYYYTMSGRTLNQSRYSLSTLLKRDGIVAYVQQVEGDTSDTSKAAHQDNRHILTEKVALIESMARGRDGRIAVVRLNKDFKTATLRAEHDNLKSLDEVIALLAEENKVTDFAAFALKMAFRKDTFRSEIRWVTTLFSAGDDLAEIDNADVREWMKNVLATYKQIQKEHPEFAIDGSYWAVREFTEAANGILALHKDTDEYKAGKAGVEAAIPTLPLLRYATFNYREETITRQDAVEYINFRYTA